MSEGAGNIGAWKCKIADFSVFTQLLAAKSQLAAAFILILILQALRRYSIESLGLLHLNIAYKI